MASDRDASDITLPYEGKQRVHERTERFIQAWQQFLPNAGAGQSRPQLLDFLGDCQGDERVAQLRELLDVDVDFRRKLGEKPAPRDYDGIPDAHQVLGSVFRDGGPGASPRGADRRDDSGRKPQQQTPQAGDEPLSPDIADLWVNPTAQKQSEKRIGPYRLLSQLGEGGFGTVYLAEREQPFRQRVALKVIKPGMDTRQVIARFEAERQALAIMDHPNIAKVLDAGATPSGRSFFVMELVHGEQITAYCDRMKLTIEQRLELFIPICHAVQHAHQKGIIHRDLKPSNILVAVVDDRPVPKIIDFGVAKAMAQPLTERTIFTEQGQMIGTPEYMSPEQAEMTNLDIDTRSDIYSLGVLLYELVTGALPFDRKSLREAGFDQIRRIIREVEPPKPSTKLSSLGEKSDELAQKRRTDAMGLRRQLRGELDWIVMKALEKDRTRRYPTALAFAEDVIHQLNHEPVAAGPPGRVYRVRKFFRRHRIPLLTAGSVALLTVAVAILATFGFLREGKLRATAEDAVGRLETMTSELKQARDQAQAEARRAESEAERAKAAQEQAERQDYATTIRLATAQLDSGHYLGVPEMLRKCKPELRSWEWGYVMSRCPKEEWKLQAHDSSATAIAVAPDGKSFATGGDDGTLAMWDTEPLRPRWIHSAGQPVRHVVVHPDGGRVIADAGDRFFVCHSDNGSLLHDSGTMRVDCFCLSGNGQLLYLGTQSSETTSRILVLDTANWNVVRSVESPGRVTHLAIGTDDKQLVALSRTGAQLWVYDPESLRAVSDVIRTQPFPTCAVVDARTGRFVWSAWKGTNFGDLTPQTPPERTVYHDLPVSALALDSESSRVVSCDQTGVARIIQLGTGRELGSVEQGTGITSASLYGSGLLLGDRFGAIRFWASTKRPQTDSRKPVNVDIGGGVRLAFRHDGRVLALRDWGDDAGTKLALWDLSVGNGRVFDLPGVFGRGFIVFRPFTNELVVPFRDSLRFLDTTNLQLNEVRRIPTQAQFPFCSFDASGNLLAALEQQEGGCSVIIYNLTTGEKRVISKEGDTTCAMLAFNPRREELLAVETRASAHSG